MNKVSFSTELYFLQQGNISIETSVLLMGLSFFQASCPVLSKLTINPYLLHFMT
jgi:hypothetical protein